MRAGTKRVQLKKIKIYHFQTVNGLRLGVTQKLNVWISEFFYDKGFRTKKIQFLNEPRPLFLQKAATKTVITANFIVFVNFHLLNRYSGVRSLLSFSYQIFIIPGHF